MPAIAEVQFKATNSQTVVTAFNSIGTAAGNAGTKVQQFTAGATTKIQQFTSSLNSIKTQGNPLSNLSTNLTGFNKSVDQSSQKVTTFGQKLKGFGSQFGSSIANIGALGGTLVGLTRQYQDLGDSQIAVDKAQLKVSKTTEAVGTAQGKLNDLTAKGVTSGAEYNKALLDVNQAMEAQSLAEQMLTERQEDHQRAQENFWIGLVPTVTTAGASIISVLNDIGGTKGLGGLKTALTGFGSKTSGLIGGIVAGISGIGTGASGSVKGIGAMTGALGSLRLAMQGVALSAAPVVIAIAGVIALIKPFGMLVHEFSSLIKGDMLEAVKSVEGLLNVFSGKSGNLLTDLMTQLNPASGIMHLIGDMAPLREEVARLKTELEKTGPAATTASSGLEGLDSGLNQTSNFIDQFLPSYSSILNNFSGTPPVAAPAGEAIAGVGTATSGAEPPVATLTTSLDGLNGSFATITTNLASYSTAFATVTAQTDPFNASLVITAQNTAAENSELALLTKSAMAGAKASDAMTRRQQELAAVLNKATQNMQKQTNASNALARANAQNTSGGYAVYGTQTGSGGGSYKVFRNGKVIGQGKGMAPPRRVAGVGTRISQHGYQGTIKRPTLFLAGEGGRPEDVTVRPRGSVQRGGSGGGVGFSGTINVYVDGVLRPARYDMGARK